MKTKSASIIIPKLDFSKLKRNADQEDEESKLGDSSLIKGEENIEIYGDSDSDEDFLDP